MNNITEIKSNIKHWLKTSLFFFCLFQRTQSDFISDAWPIKRVSHLLMKSEVPTSKHCRTLGLWNIIMSKEGVKWSINAWVYNTDQTQPTQVYLRSLWSFSFYFSLVFLISVGSVTLTNLKLACEDKRGLYATVETCDRQNANHNLTLILSKDCFWWHVCSHHNKR